MVDFICHRWQHFGYSKIDFGNENEKCMTLCLDPQTPLLTGVRPSNLLHFIRGWCVSGCPASCMIRVPVVSLFWKEGSPSFCAVHKEAFLDSVPVPASTTCLFNPFAPGAIALSRRRNSPFAPGAIGFSEHSKTWLFDSFQKVILF